MRLLVHRGQALLLLVVGGLAGAAVAAAALEWDALPAPATTRVTGFLAPGRSHLPARIEIGGRGRTPTDGAVVAAQSAPAPAIAEDGPSAEPSGQSAAPSPGTTVVPATVYAYPPGEHTGRGPGGDGTGRGGRG
jgi:hypothetical protein